jgi:2-polyprenyl-3-methyl-5-hydroxy-6-metoxy-1,4-benzoquinol methylase
VREAINMKLGVLLLAALLCGAQTPGDDQLWKDFAAWSAELSPLPSGQRKPMADAWAEHLAKRGVAKEEAAQRLERILTIRRGSNEKEAIYWNASFKLGGGPEAPLRLLQETIRKTRPGRALDAGMGRGRNAIFLASLGWDVTGYDMAPDAVKKAGEDAKQAGVKLKTVQAKHHEFAFGETQWDLILCSYNYMGPTEAPWPWVFHKALRPGGLVVFQSSVRNLPAADALLQHWRGFDVVRLERVEAGFIDDDWTPSKTNPTVRLVLRKQ